VTVLVALLMIPLLGISGLVERPGLLQPADARAAEHDLRASGRGHSARLHRA